MTTNYRTGYVSARPQPMPVTLNPDIVRPAPRRPDVETRATENKHAAFGMAWMLGGVALAVLLAWIDYAAFTRWGDWPLLAVVTGLGLIVVPPMIWYGGLSMWRNTIDEFEDSKRHKDLVAAGKKMRKIIDDRDHQIEALNVQIAELMAENAQVRKDLHDRIFIVGKNARNESQERTVDAMSESTSAIREFILDGIFGGGSEPVGIQPTTGYIKIKYPFKVTSAGAVEQAAHKRLVDRGLIEHRGNNYFWIGTRNLTDVLATIQ